MSPAPTGVSRSSCSGDAPAHAPPSPWLAFPRSFPTWRPATWSSLAAPSRKAAASQGYPLAGPPQDRVRLLLWEEDAAPHTKLGITPTDGSQSAWAPCPHRAPGRPASEPPFPGTDVNPGGTQLLQPEAPESSPGAGAGAAARGVRGVGGAGTRGREP